MKVEHTETQITYREYLLYINLVKTKQDKIDQKSRDW